MENTAATTKNCVSKIKRKISYPLASNFFLGNWSRGAPMFLAVFSHKLEKKQNMEASKVPSNGWKHTCHVIDPRCGSASGRRECQHMLQCWWSQRHSYPAEPLQRSRYSWLCLCRVPSLVRLTDSLAWWCTTVMSTLNEVETRGSLWVWGQPGLHSEALFQTKHMH